MSSTRNNIASSLTDIILPKIELSRASFRVNNHETLSLRSSSCRGPLNRNLGSFAILQKSGGDTTPHFYTDSSDTDTLEIISDETGSSNNSTFELVSEVATERLKAEWEKIERTLFEEEGDKVTRPDLIKECAQWKSFFPQLRIRGRKLTLPSKLIDLTYVNDEEILALNNGYSSDSEAYDSSESSGRRTDSCSDSEATPCNTPPEKPSQEKHFIKPQRQSRDSTEFSDLFNGVLHIAPIYPRTPSHKVRRSNQSSIVRSEISSSKWLRSKSPELIKCDSATHRRNARFSNSAKVSERSVASKPSIKLQTIYQATVFSPVSSKKIVAKKHGNVLPPLTLPQNKCFTPQSRCKSVKSKRTLQSKSFIQLKD